ncbi:MAG TPA: hypothetical protein VFK15_10985 [Burkholderiales bacterium]|nr:hypothetical protein [Burkholderiales bacterium]
MSTLTSGPRRRISRIQAFADEGVSLAYPLRSWSGVRDNGGTVVIALREGDVQSCAGGFRCLLWARVIEGATEWVDRPIKKERLGHCRLAVALGGANGLVLHGPAAEVERGSAFSLRVALRGSEYWGYWSSADAATGYRRRIERATRSFAPALMAA